MKVIEEYLDFPDSSCWAGHKLPVLIEDDAKASTNTSADTSTDTCTDTGANADKRGVKASFARTTAFIDIETTGFSANTSRVYLIGCACLREEGWFLTQWFSEGPKEEEQILDAFFQFIAPFRTLVHYNGSVFDLPFLVHRSLIHQRTYTLDAFRSADIYRQLLPCKTFMGLPNCRQKTVEQYLGIERKDIFNGGELINIYKNYVKTPTVEARETILLHNADDIRGLLSLLPALSYPRIFTDGVTVTKARIDYYQDYTQETKQELILTLALPAALPRPLTCQTHECRFQAKGDTALLRIPVLEGELKFFYSNPSDYYYLPKEDMAIHKSVSSYVEKEYRVQATQATCYTRRTSRFLPEWDSSFRTPVFKREYKSKEYFFELTEEFKADRQAFTDYANHVLSAMAAS